jgi:succinate dehydrogenase / fumarate reductase cytochrome b subunit
MGLLTDVYASSIGKKLTVGLTGALLCAFLVVHLVGNLLLFKGDGGASFDAYAEFLPSLTIIRVIEWGLFGIFLLHAVTGLLFWTRNRSARPEGYAVNRKNENSDPFSRMMFLTGSIVFIFLVIHLKTFWVPARFGETGQFSMYSIVTGAFSSPVYVGFYVVAMVLLAFHLRHGFQSAMQTFGLRNRKYTGLIDLAGMIFWLAIPVSFATIPIYFLLNS